MAFSFAYLVSILSSRQTLRVYIRPSQGLWLAFPPLPTNPRDGRPKLFQEGAQIIHEPRREPGAEPFRMPLPLR